MTAMQALSARFGRTGVFLSLAEFDAVLGSLAAGRRDRDLESARRRLRSAREKRRRAVARASRW